MFRKIGMVILLVSDLHKLITFYKEVLGMKVKHESEDWVELSTKEGSTRLALHLLQKQVRDQKQTEQTATATSVIKIRTMLLGYIVIEMIEHKDLYLTSTDVFVLGGVDGSSLFNGQSPNRDHPSIFRLLSLVLLEVPKTYFPSKLNCKFVCRDRTPETL